MTSKIVFIYDHRLRKYKKEPRIINNYATAKCDRKHYVFAGEPVFVISIQGDRMHFFKLDDNHQPIQETIYVDKKTFYVFPF